MKTIVGRQLGNGISTDTLRPRLVAARWSTWFWLATQPMAVAFTSTSFAGSDPVANKGGDGVDPQRRLLTGSDAMVTVIEFALDTAGIPITSIEYHGAGSGNGQRQLEGGYATADQPSCTPLGAGPDNAGCQEISPMSGLMDDNICNDTEAAGNAESLAICADSIVVITDNASYQSTSTGACTNVATTDNVAGTVAFLGNAVLGAHPSGASAIEPWKDVLRIVYTGYTASEPWGLTGEADPNATNDRTSRCSAPVRAALLNDWYAMFASATCNTGRCASGLRAAYRRDDGSGATGTTGVFLHFLDVKPVLTARTQAYPVVVSGNQTTPATEAHSFCDGGDFEGFLTDTTASGRPHYGDPVRKPCAAEDDLCGRDGSTGVVRAIRSVPNSYQVAGTSPAVGDQFAFPTKQCTRNVFRRAPFANTSARVCPDGEVPLAGQCWQPVYTGGGVDDFNCVNPRTSRPPGASTSFDGRVYNWTVHRTGSSPDTVGARNFEVAQWRQNFVEIPAAGNPTTDLVKVCQEVDATGNIGCVVGHTTCSIGFSSQRAALLDPHDDLNEPLVLDRGHTIPSSETHLARKLYINAIGGFEKITTDCQRRDPNQAPGSCQAQVDLVNWLRVPANAAAACTAGLHQPLPNGPTCETHVSASCTGDTTPECVAQ